MRQITKRSYSGMNRINDYNIVDARIDNPHLASRELPSIVREVRTERKYTPLRKMARSA